MPKIGKTLVQRVAEVADLEGMHETDLLKFPDRLEAHGVDPSKVTKGIAHAAHDVNREAMTQLREKYGASS